MTPEMIQAIGVMIIGIIGALTAWQQKQVKQLRERLDELEAQMAEERGKFRSAVRVIRGLLAYIGDLTSVMRMNGQDAPTNPVRIPPELEDEI